MPITPEDAAKASIVVIPHEVFEEVDSLIVRKLHDGESKVDQDDIVAALVARGFSENDIFANRYLDFEDAYRSVGWSVRYDNPGYNETGNPCFVFRATTRS